MLLNTWVLKNNPKNIRRVILYSDIYISTDPTLSLPTPDKFRWTIPLTASGIPRAFSHVRLFFAAGKMLPDCLSLKMP